MHRVEQPAKRRGLPIYLPAALALLAVMIVPGVARAQQWTCTNGVCSTTGSVGVGTATPGGKLDVQQSDGSDVLIRAWNVSTASGSAIFRAASSSNGSEASRLEFTDNLGYDGGISADHSNGILFRTGSQSPSYASMVVRMVITPGGNIGIGTSAPSQMFHVHSGGTWSGMRVTTAATGATVGDGVNFGYDDASGAMIWNREATPIVFSTSNVERVRIDASGNVGIGKSNPAEALDVVGNIVATGNIQAKYQDVAEWVPSSQKLAAGTVVVLDTDQTNHVLASAKAYDTGVAGVISANPGVILGQGGDDKVKVATTGRVKVKVDATRAPIKVGDLLVTSDVEGMAMKSEPVLVGGRRMHAPGTIIGKALEPLAGGVGEILVLLSLQ